MGKIKVTNCDDIEGLKGTAKYAWCVPTTTL